jgi:hypothetical protein
MNDAEASARFISALAAIATELSKSGIAIYGVAYDLLHFGSWTLEVGKRKQRWLIQWGGKESLMSVSQCDVADSQSPRTWKLVVEEPITDQSTHEKRFRIAANILMEKTRS